jgi:hypothetical protein
VIPFTHPLKTPSDVFKTSLRATARLHFRFQTAKAMFTSEHVMSSAEKKVNGSAKR